MQGCAVFQLYLLLCVKLHVDTTTLSLVIVRYVVLWLRNNAECRGKKEKKTKKMTQEEMSLAAYADRRRKFL